MLDPLGPEPTSLPLATLAALRGEAAPDSARAQADAALVRVLAQVEHLREAHARYTADTADNAYCLRRAAFDLTQAAALATALYQHRAELA